MRAALPAGGATTPNKIHRFFFAYFLFSKKESKRVFGAGSARAGRGCYALAARPGTKHPKKRAPSPEKDALPRATNSPPTDSNALFSPSPSKSKKRNPRERKLRAALPAGGATTPNKIHRFFFAYFLFFKKESKRWFSAFVPTLTLMYSPRPYPPMGLTMIPSRSSSS